MKTPKDPYEQWLTAAAAAQDGHVHGGISVGGLILIVLLIALLF